MTQIQTIEIRASDGSLAGHVARVRYLPTLSRRWRGVTTDGRIIYGRTVQRVAQAMLAERRA
ncbi:hypothetical protein UFOVP934_6 [uncultured Caudovirales phage]|uniref:Uncharacterized protein n=1 Tax=uncultured Caudovirales phage TaxID=2100421 RepID=A0A6J5PKX9_9CAUD|nr:hypothetical protein UFOVP934_6 [uncultured Caudovirales phage]